MRKKLTGAVDVSTTVLGLGSSALMIGALLLPVPPVVVLAAVGVCLASSAYSTGRGIVQLVDRSKREQVKLKS